MVYSEKFVSDCTPQGIITFFLGGNHGFTQIFTNAIRNVFAPHGFVKIYVDLWLNITQSFFTGHLPLRNPYGYPPLVLPLSGERNLLAQEENLV